MSVIRAVFYDTIDYRKSANLLKSRRNCETRGFRREGIETRHEPGTHPNPFSSTTLFYVYNARLTQEGRPTARRLTIQLTHEPNTEQCRKQQLEYIHAITINILQKASLRAGSLVGKGGGAATASRQPRRLYRLAVAALARDTLPKQQLVSLLAG